MQIVPRPTNQNNDVDLEKYLALIFASRQNKAENMIYAPANNGKKENSVEGDVAGARWLKH